MSILHECDPCIKHDLVILNRDTVVEDLEGIVNLLRMSVENNYFSTLTRTQIEQFWRNVSDKIQTAFFDCLHMVCC